MKRPAQRVLAAVACALMVTGLAGPASAQPAYEAITGSGSTWSQNALDQWVQDVRRNGITVSYSGVGSSAGRTQFRDGQNDFGVSEIPFQKGADGTVGDDSPGRSYAYMPIVAGGTSFMYHVRVGGQLYRGLRLSGTTIARIFTGAIRNWNDPAITADNNGKALPDKQIIPIVRGDGSGTTAQFTRWMSTVHGDIWRGYCECNTQLTSYYPIKQNKAPRMTAQTGSDRVSGAVAAAAGDGSITYVEYSYATGRNFPVVKMLNNGGFYVEPNHFNVAVALTRAQINNNPADQNYLTQILDNVYRHNDPRAYPLSSYSYAIIPRGGPGTVGTERITPGKGRSMSDFMYYFLCQGQASMPGLGYSPLPWNLVRAGFDQVKRIPNSTTKDADVGTCQNPTFDPGDANSNKLAREAPFPADCDKQGQGPCQPAPQGSNGGGGQQTGGTGGSSGNGGQGGTGTGGPAGSDPATAGVDPETGLPAGSDGDGGSELAGSATELAAFRSSDGLTSVLATVAIVQLLALLLVPPFIVRAQRRRRERET